MLKMALGVCMNSDRIDAEAWRGVLINILRSPKNNNSYSEQSTFNYTNSIPGVYHTEISKFNI